SIDVDFKRFSFNETKHINRYIDYELFKSKKSRSQKLFRQTNNPLSLFQYADNDGFIKIEDSTASVFKVRILDFQGNETWVTIPITADSENIISNDPLDTSNKSLIYANQTTELKGGNYNVKFNANTLYEDTLIDFSVVADTLNLHEDNIPLQKNYYISYDISQYKPEDRKQLFIAKLYGYYKKPSYLNTKRKGNILTAGTKTFGSFVLARDSTAPTITPVNFSNKKWLSKYRYLKVKINDDLSGISNYRATVNGKWILMEYDYKTGLLVHDFNDNVITDTKNDLKIIVTDNVGNNTTFEATFFRK
ncbi:MAG: M23 family peptidase, partial [Winogradskyella sp.]|nr:M23 family peptidase [Winogradskyella sp.]